MKTRIIELLSEKQKRLGRIISKTELKQKTKLTKPTIDRWLSGEVTRFDEKSIVELCRYLRCEIGDLLYIDWNEYPDGKDEEEEGNGSHKG